MPFVAREKIVVQRALVIGVFYAGNLTHRLQVLVAQLKPRV